MNEYMAIITIREGNQFIARWSTDDLSRLNDFLRRLTDKAIENGYAEAEDDAGCLVTATLTEVRKLNKGV